MALPQFKSENSAMTQKQQATAKTVQRPTLGFGVPAETDPHHFVVQVPRGNSGAVKVVESLGLQARDHSSSEILRVVLDRPRWSAIRQEVQRIFNLRLKQHNLKVSKWQVGDTPVDRLLGKELCVLAWAVEKMDLENIPVAVRNWMALRPEERWWLFGMAALHTGTADEGDRGWRLALRHALGDIAQQELFKPRDARRVTTPDRPALPADRDLFSTTAQE